MGHYGWLWVTMGHCSPRSLLSVNSKEVSSSLCESKWINVMARQGKIIVTTLQYTPSWSHASIASWHCMMSDTFVFRFSRLAACIAHGNRNPPPTASNWTIGCGKNHHSHGWITFPISYKLLANLSSLFVCVGLLRSNLFSPRSCS